MNTKNDIKIKKQIYRAKHRNRINKYAREYYQRRLLHFRAEKRMSSYKRYHKDIEKIREYQRKWNKKNRIKSTKYHNKWTAKNREKLKAWRRENYRKNKEKICTKRTENYWKNPEKQRAEHRLWYRKNIERVRAYSQKSREINKLKVIMHYSHGKNECACCGEKDITFLTLDHIHGGGCHHRKKLGNNGNGSAFYQYLISNNFPNDPPLQVLCHNCNFAYARYKKCPHQVKK